MLTYHQSSGQMFGSDPTAAPAVGYSGAGAYRNNPNMQAVAERGPIPRGTYDVGPPHDTQGHGPYVMTLTPHPDNEMFGRAGFLIHGDSIEHPGQASKGCIILSRSDRIMVWTDCERNGAILEVVE
jgi:hypothetical protein